MFELFNSQEIDEIFDRPNSVGLKYPWYDMSQGMSFAIPCSSIKSKHYRPTVPTTLLNEGFDITVSKRECKKTGEMFFVVTRIE